MIKNAEFPLFTYWMRRFSTNYGKNQKNNYNFFKKNGNKILFFFDFVILINIIGETIFTTLPQAAWQSLK